MGRKGPIPERWEDYKPVGKPIKGTRFIAFKVPLRPRVYEAAIESAKRTWLDHDTLLDIVPNLGLIIDLTFTLKYYQPSVFTERGVQHLKIMFEGRKLPKPPQLKIFKDRVEKFLRENENNDKLIGVHCTHGVNRTGFLICHHLITAMKMSPGSAINSFEEARGHPIERAIYTNYLRSIGSGRDMPLESPDRQLDFVSNGRNRSRDYEQERKNDARKRFFNRDYDDDDWRTVPRNFSNPKEQRSERYIREERNHKSKSPAPRRSNYYDILSGDSSRNDRRDSNDDTRGRINSNRSHRNESYEQSSRNRRNNDNSSNYASRDRYPQNGRNRDNYERYASKDESWRSGRSHDNYQTYGRMGEGSRNENNQRQAPEDGSTRNGKNYDNYQTYDRMGMSSHQDNYQRHAPKNESSRSGSNYSNYQSYAPMDESSRNDNYQRYASKNETSRIERNHGNYKAPDRMDESSRNDNYDRFPSKDESAYRSQNRAEGTRRRFEMLPDFARRRLDDRESRPIRLERRTDRYSASASNGQGV